VGAQPDVMGVNGETLWQKLYLTNYDPNNAYYLSVIGGYDFIYYNSTLASWVRAKGQPGPNSTLPFTITIPAGATNFAVYLPATPMYKGKSILVGLPFGSDICVWSGYSALFLNSSYQHGHFAGGSYSGPTAIWDSGNMVNLPSQTYAIINVHPGDMFGATPPPSTTPNYAFPYIAADGICSTSDVAVMYHDYYASTGDRIFYTNNTMTIAHVNSATDYPIDGPNGNAQSQLLRADITGSGTITAADVALVYRYWFSTTGINWAHHPVAPNPPSFTYLTP